MLHIDDITYSVAGRTLIESASASIPDGHKVGIVGRNGTGKTTLFRLIRGELALEGGSISLPSRARIGGVAQEVPGNEVSLVNTVLSYDTERAELMEESERSTDGARIAEIQTRLADIDAWSAEARASSILKGLGFTDEEQLMPCSAFSGGWRMRVALAGVLFSQPDLLLLDEPTNYLDLEGALWLETYLARYPHTVLIISHDRGLLNRAVGSILHLEDKKLTLYQGGYETFAETRAARLAAAASEAKKQDARRAHLQSFVDRFRAKASKAVQAQSRLKMIAKLKPITTPQEAALKRFTFPTPEELSPPILRIESGSVGYDGVPVLRRLNLRIDQDDRIALLGRNGEGKSTLSKLLAGKLDPIEGQIHKASKLRVGYFAQHQVEELHLDETPIDHIRRLRPEEAPAKLRARLGGFGIGAEQAETLVGKLSGGQKARLSLMLATLDAPHMLILDEPTNHLDIESREALVEALTAYSGAIILVSHDMHLLGLVADRLWLVRDGAVAPYEGDLESYRAMLLSGSDTEKPSEKPKEIKVKKPSRDAILKLRQDVKRCEERIAKLQDMESKVAAKLADPAIYDDIHGLTQWQKKYAEIEDGLSLAETLWMEALERLETAER
ncbi:ABC transporter, ATP-binding protein [Roseovarius sp. TM1035]|mgnify:FL=1|jgi:ATP-binding cassette subfamily F protein 3|uniref:Putative ABC transporter ATP-binding protein YheS n=1 Tax=Roseovarius mucosus TaxID=215743 RepID=A0A1V0RT89_9RHOB|nr:MULTISPECIES: ABC-F family ATP-binding cassette domain-containing protein [Roseovarius]ARE84906.1 putative ABC transporter ATP-binding protein YheS [Roseovarius mucosus]AWZ21043.1 ABC transporter ATP-binding protein uup [Roseovarius sp. AK1035]EDM32921.1 ABC transporter, ATP-binding protein [Roseovarius sp. TM1035]MBW4975889.1 ABC-F family ATP-binding cassette domain-containing protein [Roseovarius mucosus]